MPLTELWDDHGPLPLRRRRLVGHLTIAELLSNGPVQFVIANIGQHLEWIPVENCYRIWKEKVKPRLVEPNSADVGFSPDDFPGGYCFVATEWHDGEAATAIVLESYH